MTAGLTPSQTVGPFLAIGLPWPDGPFVVPEGTAGAIALTGRVFDGAGEPVTHRPSPVKFGSSGAGWSSTTCR